MGFGLRISRKQERVFIERWESQAGRLAPVRAGSTAPSGSNLLKHVCIARSDSQEKAPPVLSPWGRFTLLAADDKEKECSAAAMQLNEHPINQTQRDKVASEQLEASGRGCFLQGIHNPPFRSAVVARISAPHWVHFDLGSGMKLIGVHPCSWMIPGKVSDRATSPNCTRSGHTLFQPGVPPSSHP